MPTTISHERTLNDGQPPIVVVSTKVEFNEAIGFPFVSIVAKTTNGSVTVSDQELHIMSKEQALTIARTIIAYCRGELDNANNHNDNIEIPN